MKPQQGDAFARIIARGSCRRRMLPILASTLGLGLALPGTALACKKVGTKCDRNSDCCDGPAARTTSASARPDARTVAAFAWASKPTRRFAALATPLAPAARAAAPETVSIRKPTETNAAPAASPARATRPAAPAPASTSKTTSTTAAVAKSRACRARSARRAVAGTRVPTDPTNAGAEVSMSGDVHVVQPGDPWAQSAAARFRCQKARRGRAATRSGKGSQRSDGFAGGFHGCCMEGMTSSGAGAGMAGSPFKRRIPPRDVVEEARHGQQYLRRHRQDA